MSAAILLAAIASASTTQPCGSNVAFVDLGANDGQSLTWFRQHWAPRSPKAFTDVVAFEMNPHFEPVLRTLLQPWGGTLVPAAAWTSNGSLNANLQLPGSRTATKGGVLYNMTGSALELGGVPLNRNARSQRATTTRQQQHEARQAVPTVDLSAWLKSRYCPADSVDLKMDIEGAEASQASPAKCTMSHTSAAPRLVPRVCAMHPISSRCLHRLALCCLRSSRPPEQFEVLEHMLRSGTASLVDSLSVEWHTSKRGKGGARTALQARQRRIEEGLQRAGVKLVDWKDARSN